MAKMSKAAAAFDVFADTTPPRSDAADPDRTRDVTPAAVFRPPAAPVELPEPREASGDSPALSGTERQDLATCEAAIDTLRTAFAAAGKALQVIRAGKLYRETHATFEGYLADRWEMSTSQAYRLIEVWPLAERLSPMGDKLNERQVRELLPFAGWRGFDAAELVYRTIVETDGVKVTAGVIKGAVSVLPEDAEFDREQAVAQIRAYLAGELQPATPAVVDPGVQVERFRAGLRRFKVEQVRAAGPEAVRELAGELRELAERLEAGAE